MDAVRTRANETFGLIPFHTEALHIYSDRLSEYEKDEILDYQEVYYVGETSLKNMATKQNAALNHGYDDERGDFLVVEHDHILFRYEIIDVLGKGSFGQVLRCRDHRTGEMVALKVIRNKKRFHHQALVEIKVLENLKRWVSGCRVELAEVLPWPVLNSADSCFRIVCRIRKKRTAS